MPSFHPDQHTFWAIAADGKLFIYEAGYHHGAVLLLIAVHQQLELVLRLATSVQVVLAACLVKRGDISSSVSCE